ncbi:hypothetical protein FGQ54_12360 [Acinetobacter lwoffii]|nr:hypothetical protein FGQ54_12360 [Acinetobacter lwoffii]
MVRGIANSKIGFGDLILLLRYFFKLKVSTHPINHIFPKHPFIKFKTICNSSLKFIQNQLIQKLFPPLK